MDWLTLATLLAALAAVAVGWLAWRASREQLKIATQEQAARKLHERGDVEAYVRMMRRFALVVEGHRKVLMNVSSVYDHPHGDILGGFGRDAEDAASRVGQLALVVSLIRQFETAWNMTPIGRPPKTERLALADTILPVERGARIAAGITASEPIPDEVEVLVRLRSRGYDLMSPLD